MKAYPDEKRHGAKKVSPPPKGNCVPDSKPENAYKKNAKGAEKARAAGKKK